MPIDISSGFKDAANKLNAFKTYGDVAQSVKDAAKKQTAKINDQKKNVSSTLGSLKDFQGKIFRGSATSLEQLLDLISVSKGSGNQTISYIKKKLIEASITSEPEIKKILRDETFKILGCSEEQTYTGQPISSDSSSHIDGLLIPIKSIDLFSNLKNSDDTLIGKLFYESENLSTDSKYVPFGGSVKYPLNKEIYNRIQKENKSYRDEYGVYYNGKSKQPLFDFSYVKQYGEDYLKVILVNRQNDNLITEFLFDYYETIKLYDSSDVLNNILNVLLNSSSIEAKIGFSELKTQSKFNLIIQRILGLCFDQKEEIDVSGAAKIPEIDIIDDSFFKLSEADLKKIDSEISDIQEGVIRFETCDNVVLPINSSSILNSVLEFKTNLDGANIEEKISSIERIIDSIVETPEWKNLFPDTLALKLNIDKEIIKNLPKALVYSVLTPKILLPIFILLKSIEREAKNNANSVVDDFNQIIDSQNTINSEINNFVNDSVDFALKFKKFTIESVSKIGSIYLKTLYDILKKDILNLIKSLIKDINKSNILKKYSIIVTLSGILISVANLIIDHRKCRSLLDNILNILNLVNTSFINKSIPSGGTDPIPAVLLPFTKFLPGFSPERATINIIQEMQKLGLPTGPMPDGSPNLFLQFVIAAQKGADAEETENGKVVGVLDPNYPFIIRAKKV